MWRGKCGMKEYNNCFYIISIYHNILIYIGYISFLSGVIVLIATNATPHVPHCVLLSRWEILIPSRGKNIFLTRPQMSRNFDPQEITAFRWFDYGFQVV